MPEEPPAVVGLGPFSDGLRGDSRHSDHRLIDAPQRPGEVPFVDQVRDRAEAQWVHQYHGNDAQRPIARDSVFCHVRAPALHVRNFASAT